jgi:hypothetical protein
MALIPKNNAADGKQRHGGRRLLTLHHFHCFVLIYLYVTINAAEEGRKAESNTNLN